MLKLHEHVLALTYYLRKLSKMVHATSGSFQAQNPEKNSSFKAGKSVPSKDGLEENPSLCMRNHVNSVTLPSEGAKSCTELTCSLSCLAFPGRQSFSPKEKIQKLQVPSSGLYVGASCLDFHNTATHAFQAVSFSYKKSMRKSRSQVKATNGGITWMSLPGLLEHGDDMDFNGIVKHRKQKETAVWNGFAPLQKVLIVAVTAAAAAAAKQKNSKETRNLQRAIDIRDKDLENLREKIGQLQEHLSFWKEQAQSFCVEAKDAEVIDSVFSHGTASPLPKVGLESTPKCDALMLEQVDTPQIGNVLRKMPERVACFRRNVRASSFRQGISRFEDTMSKERPAEENHEIRAFLDRLSESPSLNARQLGASTPESLSNSFSPIRTSQLDFKNASPGEDDCQKEFERRAEDSAMAFVPRVLVLELKAIMRQILNKETPEIIAALSSVKEKVQRLEPAASGQTDLFHSYHSESAITGLKDNIDRALAKINLLQNTVGGVLDVLVEDPQSTVSLSHGKGQIPTSQEMYVAKVGKLTDVDKMIVSTLTSTKGQQGVQTQVNSPAVQFVINSTIDTLLTTVSGRCQCATDSWSSEKVIEQLLGELESAATKVASMETQIKVLKKTQMSSKQSNVSRWNDDKLTCPTCKELDFKVRLLEDAEKRLAACREACKEKERSISMLEEEIAALQETVSDLRSIQVTPKVVTSNMLFNLDSPVKFDSPQRGAKSPFSSWRGPHELSRESTSLDRRSERGSCDSDLCRSDGGNGVPYTEDHKNNLASILQAADGGLCRSNGENNLASILQAADSGLCRSNGENHVLHTEDNRNDSAYMQQAAEMYRSDGSNNVSCSGGYMDEPGCPLQAAKGTSYNAITMVRETGKDYRMYRSGEEETISRSSSSTDEWLRKTGTCSTRSSSDNSSSGSVGNARLPQPPRSCSNHARKLKLAHATDLRNSEGSNRNMPSETVTARHRGHGILLNNKGSNVLAGVEPNTPMRDRKFSGGSKERPWGHSLDSFNKAKENFAHRRRWM